MLNQKLIEKKMAKIEEEGTPSEDEANQVLTPEFRQYTRETLE